MTSKAKVVSLTHRPGSPEASGLVAECRSLANQFLARTIQELFQKNDDTLFGFAEKSKDEEANGRYFEAMRALRLKKDEIVRGFMERVGQGFAQLQTGDKGEIAAGAPQAPVTLSLLDDSELEESLAIQSMAEKVESRCSGQLSPLRHRLGSVIGGTPLEARGDPLGPARLAECYREALRLVQTDIEVRLVLYKLFDKELLSEVDELYADLNELLAKNGVMPEFKLEPRPVRARERKRQERRQADESHDQGSDETSSAELLPLLRELLTQQRGGSPGAGAEGGLPLDPREVMSALSNLQQQIKTLQSDGTAPVSPDAVRAALLGPGGAGNSLSRQDSDVIDLISMLFESILDDRAVPDSVRVLLARLQIPMLKVALVDRSFFSKPRHPARRLLNMLAKAGIGLDDTPGAEQNPRLIEIERIVTSILDNLTDDLTVFETLADGFEAFLGQQTEREVLVAKRQTFNVRAREAKEQIRMAVHRKLDEFLAAQPVPAPVGELLRGPWTEVLIESRLVKDQTMWAARSQLIRDVINSVTPKASREERLAMPLVIARIIPGLRSGLGAIGYPMERIDAMVAMLEPYHLAVVQGRPLPSDQEVPRRSSASGEAMDGEEALAEHAALIAEVEAQIAGLNEPRVRARPTSEEPASAEAAFAEEIVLSSTGPAANPFNLEEARQPQDEYLQLARGFEVNTWFTFNNPDGRTRRAKLTWKSNLLDECIFLDWRMRMVADLTMSQFAGGLYDGTIAELQDTPLFERAMDTLMGRLKKKPA